MKENKKLIKIEVQDWRYQFFGIFLFVLSMISFYFGFKDPTQFMLIGMIALFGMGLIGWISLFHNGKTIKEFEVLSQEK